jgi:non-ribosomal peptide synthetase component E (peptide arylation enzyme)
MYRKHPWLLTVLATDRPPTGPAVLAMVDHVVSTLTHLGFEPAEAYRAYLVLSGYTQGMALLIQRKPADTDYRTWRSATHRRLEHTGRLQQRPWLTAASQTNPDTDLDTWFDFGLHRMLDGLLR